MSTAERALLFSFVLQPELLFSMIEIESSSSFPRSDMPMHSLPSKVPRNVNINGSAISRDMSHSFSSARFVSHSVQYKYSRVSAFQSCNFIEDFAFGFRPVHPSLRS